MTLRDELLTDELGRGYASMSDQEVVDSLLTVDRTRVRASMSGDQIFQQTDAAEFNALSAGRQQMWVSFCARGSIDPGAGANVAFVEFIFGKPSATRTALVAARVENLSRAQEVGIPTRLFASHIEAARA